MSRKTARKAVGKKALRFLLSLVMVALLVPYLPAYAADEPLPTQSEAAVAETSPEATALEGEPAVAEATGEATAETGATSGAELPDTPEPPAPQQEATFATLSEAVDAGAVARVPSDPEAYVANEIIVVLAGENTESSELVSVEESLVELSETDAAVETELLSPDLDGSSTALVELPADVSVADALLQLANDESVAFAQPNFYYTLLDDEGFEDEPSADDASGWEPLQTTNDPLANDANQWWLGAVKAYGAWDVQRDNGAVTVAVIDTGVRLNHIDLKNNIHPLAYDAYRQQLLSKSVADGVVGYGGDDNGHGTHVAGIIAAQANNGQLGAGVSYNAKILPVSVSGPGSSITTTTVRSAYDYVIAHRYDANIRVVNISLGEYGSKGDDTQIHNKIIQAKNVGILTVCAGGNGNSSTPCYPSDYPEVTSVVSVNTSLLHSSFSDYNEFKDIAAPGESILSTSRDAVGATETRYGTSMATPVVSGIAALLFARNPSLTPAQVQQVLYDTVTDRGTPGRDDLYGHGLVNALAAVAAVAAKYIVIFDPNGGSVSPESVMKDDGDSIGTLPTPTRTGHTFDGWFTTRTGGTPINDVATLVTANVTYYAHWTIKTYTVTFKDWNGTTLATRTVNHGSAATAPSVPARVGYNFTGWDRAFTNVTDNLTATAQYAIKTYTVTFKSWNGTTLATRTVNHGAAATAPSAPARTGHTFTGWDRSFTNVTATLTVTAQYSVNTYTITLNSQGGTGAPASVTRTYGSAVGTLTPAPTRSGYVFAGWYTTASGGTKVASTTTVTGNITYYAQWAANNLSGSIVTIASALNRTRVFDMPRSSTTTGTIPILWDAGISANQRWRLVSVGDGYYSIRNVRSGLALDLSGSRVNDGEITQWTYHGGNNQLWRLIANVNGSYTIVSKVNESFCIDLPRSSSANGTVPIVWARGQGQANQQFYLNVISRSLPDGVYTLGSAASSSRFIDISRSSRDNGATALLWTKTTNDNQKFRLTYNVNTGYYAIAPVHSFTSGKVLDVQGGSTSTGANVIQWASHGGFNQQWYVASATGGTYAIRSAASGLALDVQGGSTSTGASLIMWTWHGGANQRWVLAGA